MLIFEGRGGYERTDIFGPVIIILVTHAHTRKHNNGCILIIVFVT